MKPTVWPQIWVAGGIRIRYEHGELDGLSLPQSRAMLDSELFSSRQRRQLPWERRRPHVTRVARIHSPLSAHQWRIHRPGVAAGSAAWMQKWMLALKENVHSRDYCERGTHGGAKRQALDLPTRWPRFYSSWAPRQFHHSTAWKHGRADDFFVGS